MKTVITVLAFVVMGIIACDTPEPATTTQPDSTGINSNKPDTSMRNADTTVRRDSVPGR